MFIFKKQLWRGLTAILAFFLCVAGILGSWAFDNAMLINGGLGIETSKLIQLDDDNAQKIHFSSAYLSDSDLEALYKPVTERTADEATKLTAAFDKLQADEFKHTVTEMEEGAVLLKNSGNALPLASTERKVTLFGHATVQPLYRPRSGGPDTDYSGNGALNPANLRPDLITYRGAMETAGFTINTMLFDAYNSSFLDKTYLRSGKVIGTGDGTGGGAGAFNTAYKLGERPASFYTTELKASWVSNFNDVAIVMFAREGGEERDLPMNDHDGISNLALHQEEKDLLAMVKNDTAFKKRIVLVNSPYAMELDWLEEYNIDACLWIGGTGLRGFDGVANVLTGKANPSGKLVNIYAANSLSSAAIPNAGNFQFTNSAAIRDFCKDTGDFVDRYVVRQEGIYTGYRYYETRYEDIVLGRYGANSAKGSTDGGAWNYAKEVTFPFGYGLSYTTFTQTLDSVVVGDDTITAKVTVKNTGNVAGKNVVQLYAQTPYGEYERTNLVEKSAVQLAGFTKTGILAANATEQVTVTVDKYLLASYDAKGYEGYYLSSGDYYFAIGNDSHDALNNILKAKGASGMVDQNGTASAGDTAKTYLWNLGIRDANKYSKSITGENVTNQFADADLNYWIPNSVKYLTRQDWNASYPATISVTATQAMIKQIDGYTYEKPADSKKVSDWSAGVSADEVTIMFASLKDVPFDGADSIWEKFLNQLTVDEMTSIMTDMFRSAAVNKIAKPAQVNHDGPDGVQANANLGNVSSTNFTQNPNMRRNTCYVNQVVLASTWNVELAKKRGEFIGEDCLYSKVSQLWSPGGNLHRTPFSGRNYEYYSECPVVSYLFAGVQVDAMTKKGVAVAIKHLASNDFETNRYGSSNFMTEQTFRELCLKGFESAYTIGKSLSVMTSYTRLGCTYVGASDAMQNQVMRKEWGFKGANITDGIAQKNYQHGIESLVGGSDMFCIDYAGGSYTLAATQINNAIKNNDDGTLVGYLRNANKNFYYAFSRTNLINGLTANTVVETITPWWEYLVSGLLIGMSIITALSAVMLFISVFFVKDGKFGLNLAA